MGERARISVTFSCLELFANNFFVVFLVDREVVDQHVLISTLETYVCTCCDWVMVEGALVFERAVNDISARSILA